MLESRSFILTGSKQNRGNLLHHACPNYIPTTFFIYDFSKCVWTKLAWHRGGRSCDDARCVCTLTTSSVPRCLWVYGEPARHLINSWASSAWDTYQLLVAVGHRWSDKPLNTTSGLNNDTEMRLDVLKGKRRFGLFHSSIYCGSEGENIKTYQNLICDFFLFVFCFVICSCNFRGIMCSL